MVTLTGHEREIGYAGRENDTKHGHVISIVLSVWRKQVIPLPPILHVVLGAGEWTTT